MIKPLNNISFKAVRLVHNSQFSKSQKNVAEDIQTKLGKKGEEKDFVIEPLADDIVELSEVYNVKEKGVGVDKYIEYSNPLLIGRYNEENLFNYEDYTGKIKELYKDVAKMIASSIATIGLICLGFFLLTPKPNKAVKQAERVEILAKDSLQTLKQDSLKLTQESLRIFK